MVYKITVNSYNFKFKDKIIIIHCNFIHLKHKNKKKIDKYF